MTNAFVIAGRSFKDLWGDFAFLILVNLLWTLFALMAAAPFFGLTDAPPLALWGASLLLGLPLPIISAGLCFVTNQITRGVAVGWGTFWAGIRRYWVKGLLVALVNLVVLLLIGANLRFYALVVEGGWTAFALAAWLVLAIYWLLAQFFWFPMVLELESERPIVALRHALALVAINPGFTAVLALIVVIVSAICIFLTVPAALFLASWFLLVANHATRSRLARIRKVPYRPGEMDE